MPHRSLNRPGPHLIIISHIIIVLLQSIADQTAFSLIASARTFHQIKATVKAGLVPALTLSWALSPICVLIAPFLLPPPTWTVCFLAVVFLLATYINTSVKLKRLAALRKRYGARQAAEQGVRSPHEDSSDTSTGEEKASATDPGDN
ncbi:hypothetical protein N7457_001512 [Penicillium paradoxum]|uniref:uncharacterized protein n=1 Tax=Penicillium paradoxum TaxID=176176 RepID=UPI0025480874|nr:uncharacterized protein N7457_001512 [Penicillium paradoxum]KAJ5794913.1 hypothetical protein N7457_001512 [Penicillium paradoxum]